MGRKIIVLFFVFSATAFFACGETATQGAVTDADALGQKQSRIIDGIPDYTHDAVVFVYPVGCSGTIIHRDGIYAYVLTAAHCVPPNGVDPPTHIVQADDWTDADAVVYPVDDYTDHGSYSGWDYDFALIRILGAGSATPIIPAKQAPDGLSSGTGIRHVGYGLLDYPSGDTTQRHYGMGTVDTVYTIEFTYDAPTEGPCHGDSGGPQLTTSGTERVVGVTSRGDPGCTGTGISGRVASQYSYFIHPYITDTPVPDCDACFTGATSGVGACMTEVDACYDDTDCYALLQCFNDCADGDQQCVQDCVDQHQSGYQIYLQIYDCVCDTACVDECGSEPMCDDPLGDLGDPCNDASECESDICVDGRCCNGACSGQCEACDVSGHLGYCTPVVGAPHGTRPACAGDGTVCDGSCDGTNTGACDYPGAETECRAASCTDAVAVLAADCNGSGACPAEQLQDCSPFDCDGIVCGGGCITDGDCPDGYYCDAEHQCQYKLELGADCSSGNQCLSGNCVDGFCCNSMCLLQCQACDVSGQEGTCSPVTGAPHGSRPACDSDGSVCGGNCNGVYVPGCTYPGAETQCRDASCTSAVATLPAYCNGSGACPGLQTQDCAPYDCVGDQCGGCQNDSDCADGEYCSGGVCSPKLQLGEVCSDDNQCLSTHCADGVCCDDACSGQCEACDAVGSVGECVAISGAPHGSRPACASDGTVCAGGCDGIDPDACAYPGSETQCREASCTDAVATLEAFCDGAGACPDVQTQDCDPYECNGDRCDGPCETDADCPSGTFCSAGMCVDKFANGEDCAAANQCSSGNCTDGVCCDDACQGQCEACDVAGHVGTCTPVEGAPHGSRQQCKGTGTVCGGACDGVNTLSCSYPGDETVCRDASCTNAVAVLEASCDGAGSCPSEQTVDCSPYGCVGDQCDGDCTVDEDCEDGYFCAAGMCLLQFETGETCATDNQCLSGFCTDGVCCDSACDGQCEACDLAGSEGSCLPVEGVPHGGRSPCPGTGICGAVCDGVERYSCVYPGQEQECSPASCNAGVQTSAAYCDGEGSCEEANQVSCGNYVCGDSVCLTSCNDDEDCVVGFVCEAGACIERDQGDNGDGGCGCAAHGSGALGMAGILAGLYLAVPRRRRRNGEG